MYVGKAGAEKQLQLCAKNDIITPSKEMRFCKEMF